jgi:hypothetical protein
MYSVAASHVRNFEQQSRGMACRIHQVMRLYKAVAFYPTRYFLPVHAPSPSQLTQSTSYENYDCMIEYACDFGLFLFNYKGLRRLGGSFNISGLFGFTGRSSFQSRLGTSLTGLCLFGKSLLLDINSLQLVDLLEQDRLVLELVTLGEHVQRVVDVLVNLSLIPHLLQKTTQDASSAHPQNLEGKTSIGGTSTLTNTYNSATNEKIVVSKMSSRDI